MKHLVALAICALLLGTQVSSHSLAQAPAATPTLGQSSAQGGPSSAELDAIRAESQAFVAAFNARDAKAVAAMWTPDGEYIDDTGRVFTGRDAIEKVYAEFFDGSDKAKIRVTIDSLRLLSAGVAIEDGRAVLEPAPVGAAGFSQYTAVHVKRDGRWLMASVRDAWIEAPAAVQSAADLAWLVGTWVAEEHGVKIESVIGWVADGRFLERQYTTTQVDGTKSSGVQLIGWNPLGGHVQSWDFSPDGGHAVGVWSAQQDGWTAQMRGVAGDGTTTASLNVFRRLDDNAYVWQSVQRSAGGIALPDTDEVVLKRQKAAR